MSAAPRYDDSSAALTDSGDESASSASSASLIRESDEIDLVGGQYKGGQDGSSSDGDSVPVGEEDQDPESTLMAARAYQLEMLKASLEDNVIVAMDTGSGKTQVAVLRIIAELERSSSEKLIWFLAPTVPLCSQQYEVLKAQIPAVQAKLLTGDHDVDSWSEQEIWDAALLNTRIVVSTFQVLLDALSHAFVSLGSLGLIVFDEAHNCTKRNPGRRIMTDFYWPAKKADRPVPSILGLTASPVIGSQMQALEDLEQTLDALCKSPTQHREELLTHVKRPAMIINKYEAVDLPSAHAGFTQNMLQLRLVVQGMDILQDPYVRYLRQQNTEKSRARLRKTLEKHDTKVTKHMQSFCRKTVEICRDLGAWAADYYICEVVQRFTTKISQQHQHLLLEEEDVEVAEDLYLHRLYQSIHATRPLPQSLDISSVSPKVKTLLDLLQGYDNIPAGIIFAKERATVSVLSHILTIHPQLSSRYTIGAIVGTSSWGGKRQDSLNLLQSDFLLSLQKFRAGKINLLVATSVLEEGIDVPACNLVVCLDRPESLREFIQRRGRARLHTSQLHLFTDNRSGTKSADEWLSLEQEMKAKYEDEMRELQELERIEESEIPEYRPLTVQATGARLTIDDAKGHLQHFCATLSSRKFVSWKPEYIIDDVSAAPMLKATVILPVSLPQHLRQATSLRAWQAEKNASKDAAFQAYKALYHAGLINDNLLPIRESDLVVDSESRPGFVTIKEQFSPWLNTARSWATNTPQRSNLKLLDERGSQLCQFDVVLPVPVPDFTPLSIYLDPVSRDPWKLEPVLDGPQFDVDGDTDALEHTTVLLAMSYGYRWPMSHRHQLVRFAIPGRSLKPADIGRRAFQSDLFAQGSLPCLVRDGAKCPYIYDTWIPDKPSIDLVKDPYKGFEDGPEGVPYVVVKPWPKKVGFFHCEWREDMIQSPSKKPYTRVIPAPECLVDSIPITYGRLGQLIPSITRAIEIYLVASELQSSTRLRELEISKLSLITEAITASAARGPTNYERLEFLGDCILKVCATVNCAAQHLHWPEGYLTLLKSNRVSNSTLSRAAVEFGLGEFICTRQSNLKDWRKLYETDLTQTKAGADETRSLSTKTLADVVEALIGVAYVDGGAAKALQCIALFIPPIPHLKWQTLEVGQKILYDAAPDNMPLPSTLKPVEDLLGYTFTKKSLLVEAMTHSSYCAGIGDSACFERCEFLGDAILDKLVVPHLFAASDPRPLANSEMHLIRTALVNADFLGFLVMEFGVPVRQCDVVVVSGAGAGGAEPPHADVVAREVVAPLWCFMRFSSSELGVEQQAARRRHEAAREQILEALERGAAYPWALLARLRAQKFYSDLFEAVLGAVWIDSGGDERACEGVLERCGLLPYMRRVLREGIHMWHPKEELGRLADREKVVYVTEMQREGGVADGQGEGGGPRANVFTCRLSVGTDFSVVVRDGVSKDESRVRAAEVAVRLWKERAARRVGG